MPQELKMKSIKLRECSVYLGDILKTKGSKPLHDKVKECASCPLFEKEDWAEQLSVQSQEYLYNYDPDVLEHLIHEQGTDMRGKISDDCEGELEEELNREIPCRRKEINKLLGLIGRCKDQLPSSIFIYGHSGTGKSHVTKKILEKLNHRHVIVDCVQCYMPKLLYMTILNEVSGHQMTEENDYEPYAACDNILDFITNLKASMKTKSFIIILDKCERLRDLPKTVLPAFLRLKQLTGLNICVILLSTIIVEKFYVPKGYFETIPVHFRNYSKDEIYEILSQSHEWKDMDNLYKNYLKLFLNVFYTSCRDLHELRYMVNTNFAKHSKLMVSSAAESHKLWQVAMPHLKASLEELYQRTAKGNQERISSEEFALSFELPYYSKYFLIAAYLASYIPSKLDKALFMKYSSKRKKKRINRSKNDILSDMLLGPKPFTVDRLLAIFYSIVDGDVSFTVNLYVQISSLVKLRLLTMVNSSIDSPRYKCTVSLEFIKTIARTVSFDIIKYLFPPK